MRAVSLAGGARAGRGEGGTRLHGAQVGQDELQRVRDGRLAQLVHDARVVELGREHLEELAQQRGLLLEEEVDRRVVQLGVADLWDALEELLGREGDRRVVNHGLQVGEDG